MKFSRTTVNFILDCFLLVNFLSLVFVGTIVRFVFPEPHQATGWRLWSWSLDQWIRLQFGVLAMFALAILLHVMLHWSWVCGVVSGWLPKTDDGRKRNLDEGSRTVTGVALLIVLLNLLGVLIAAAAITIDRPG